MTFFNGVLILFLLTYFFSCCCCFVKDNVFITRTYPGTVERLSNGSLQQNKYTYVFETYCPIVLYCTAGRYCKTKMFNDRIAPRVCGYLFLTFPKRLASKQIFFFFVFDTAFLHDVSCTVTLCYRVTR